MFNSLRIRSKLAFALLIPLLALVLSSSLVIAAANRRADDASAKAAAVAEQVALATAALGPSGILTALNDERTAQAIDLLGVDPTGLGTATLDETRQATDQAMDEFRTAISQKPAAVQATYQPAIDGLAGIPPLRTRSDASTSKSMGNPVAAEVFDGYIVVVNTVFDANTRAALGVDNRELRAGVRFIDQLTRYQDVTSVIQRVIGGALTFNPITVLSQDPPSLVQAAGLDAVASELRGDLEKVDHPVYRELARAYFSTPSVAAGVKLREDAVADVPVSIADMIGPSVAGGTDAYRSILDGASARLQADADGTRGAAQAEADTATSQAALVVGITGAVLILAVVVTVVASRSITRPLSRLVGAAEDMATKKLPTAVKEILEAPMGEDVEVPELTRIDDRGGYEIAEVASALNSVQRSAADLAVEQAVLRRNIADAFVNLGRRNQNLLTRLLQSITEMERDEADPDQLQQLFGLDHLATRMRRNAESLVVLAGTDTRRRHSAPVPVIDVLRGAQGEVEDYERAEIVAIDEALVDGGAVSDVTHLIAELLENALTHSPPHRDVEIRGRAHTGGYRLAIIDHGVGMEPEDMAVANTRLSGGESFTVAPSRYLGHYVVGRQANRLGLTVVLRDTPGGGTTAEIEIGPVISVPEIREPDPALPSPRDARYGHRALTTGTAAVGTVSTSESVAGDRPETLAEALGQNGNDTDATAPAPAPAMTAAPAARQELGETTGQEEAPAAAPAPVAPTAPATTTNSGYARRVRGANTPSTVVRSARTDGTARKGASGAEGVRSALNTMQAGMERSRAEAEDSTGTMGETEEP